MGERVARHLAIRLFETVGPEQLRKAGRERKRNDAAVDKLKDGMRRWQPLEEGLLRLRKLIPVHDVTFIQKRSIVYLRYSEEKYPKILTLYYTKEEGKYQVF